MSTSGKLYDDLFGWAPQATSMDVSPFGRGPQAAPSADLQRVQQASTDIRNNTQGRATELANDPTTKSALDFFGKVMGGGVGPYTQQSKAAILGQNANASAAGQAAQMAALRDATAASGGSIYDPGFQAKSAELNSMRQGQNLDAMGQLESKAAEANFGARMEGAGQLAATRQGQNAQINQMRGLAADYQGRTTAAVPSNGMPGQMIGGIQQPMQRLS